MLTVIEIKALKSKYSNFITGMQETQENLKPTWGTTTSKSSLQHKKQSANEHEKTVLYKKENRRANEATKKQKKKKRKSMQTHMTKLTLNRNTAFGTVTLNN